MMLTHRFFFSQYKEKCMKLSLNFQGLKYTTVNSNPVLSDLKAFEEAFRKSDVLSLSFLTAESVQNND